MTDIKLTVAIPYYRRLHNISLAFEALANQTMQTTQFEVVVGAMEYSTDYVDLCHKFANRLDITSVLTDRSFDIPRARNLCLRQARGRAVVQMDADTLLPATALQNLWDRYFAFGQSVCVVGQVVGYGNNEDGDVAEIDDLPLTQYLPALDEVGRSMGRSIDQRFGVPHIIPWAFAWTGLIALPMQVVRAHNLYFDETFQGWGVDDLEWGYRVCASGTPIVLREDVHALHLPHMRDASANRETESANYHRFLRKWPTRDVELAHAIGDVAANAGYLDFLAELARVDDGSIRGFGTARGTVDGVDVLLMGVELDAAGRVSDQTLRAVFDSRRDLDVLPLVGVGTPYPDASIGACQILPRLDRLASRYLDLVRVEAQRVARRVTRQPPAGTPTGPGHPPLAGLG